MNKLKIFTLQSDERVEAYQITGNTTTPCLMIAAGVHGGENTPVQVAYEFLDFLRSEPLNGSVTLIPIVNIDGFARNSRENPRDGKNINAAGKGNHSHLSSYSLSDSIADELMTLAQNHDYFLDLHSAFKSRYLTHVYYHHPEDLELARQFGFRFVVPHFTSKTPQTQSKNNKPIGVRIREAGTPSLTLEIGGGVMVRRKDVQQGIEGLKNFTRYVGILSGEQETGPTPKDQVFTQKRDEITTVVKAPLPGDLFFQKSLGEVVEQGENIAYIIDLNTRKRHFIHAPVRGRLVMKRILTRIETEEVGKETIFRLMPEKAQATD